MLKTEDFLNPETVLHPATLRSHQGGIDSTSVKPLQNISIFQDILKYALQRNSWTIAEGLKVSPDAENWRFSELT